MKKQCWSSSFDLLGQTAVKRIFDEKRRFKYNEENQSQLIKTYFGIVPQISAFFNQIHVSANMKSANVKISFSQQEPIYPDKEAETGRRTSSDKERT